ncbi:MAG: class I SAM-dependent methyltransferase [bacterium]
MLTEIERKEIEDYSIQWKHATDNSGYYGSRDLFLDIIGPLEKSENLVGKTVADIGSGTGRIVNMLLDVGVARVIAIEPSESYRVIESRVDSGKNQVEVVHDIGEAVGRYENLDYVFSFGVIDHIQHPEATMRAAYKSLKPGGSMLIWVYGYEGNEFYLKLFHMIHWLTPKLPHWLMATISNTLAVLASGYGFVATVIPLPMARYFKQHFNRLSFSKRCLTFYDQLKPTFAKYFREDEARALFTNAGFVDVQLYHRHGYSWTVRGNK